MTHSTYSELSDRVLYNMKPDYSLKDYNCRDLLTYNQIIHFLEKTFSDHGDELKRIRGLAHKIKEGIEKISPFIQQTTQMVCPYCKDVCCINKHGYYNFEDLVYLYALGSKPPHYEFGRKDSDPCQYLSENGCSMERSRRPSGCNWYFCDSLLDHMEISPDYQNFDESLRDVAELWIKMIEEFARISTLLRA